MNKKKLPIIATIGIILSIITVLSLGMVPSVEGIMTIRISQGAFQPGTYLGDETEITAITMTTADDITYTFSATGETIINIPENTIIDNIAAWVTINDNYASSTAEAISRTRIEVILTDPDSVVQYADNLEGAENAGAVPVGGTHYLVIRSYSTSIQATPGTWDIDTEYFVFAIPV